MNTTAAVLGPGAVGGSLAVRLSNAGVPVICVAHPEAAGLIALAGLVVESPEGALSGRMEVVEQLAKPVRLLLVTVKAPALEDAVQRVDPDAVADGVVIPLLNGLEHMELLRERFGDRVAAGSMSHFQAYRAGRVQIIEATGSPVITVASESLPRGEIEAAAEILRRARLDDEPGEGDEAGRLGMRNADHGHPGIGEAHGERAADGARAENCRSRIHVFVGSLTRLTTF